VICKFSAALSQGISAFGSSCKPLRRKSCYDDVDVELGLAGV
jgi:hypothetical protein